MAEHGEALSQREREVLDLVATGMTNRQIAQELVVSPNTVKVHLRNIFTKLGVESRTEATLTAIREGWVSVPMEKSAPVKAEPSVQALPDKPPALPPLPWVKRLALVGILLLVTVVSVATWPQAQTEAIPRNPHTDKEINGSGNIGAEGENSKWHALAPMITARSNFALVASGEELFAIGGDTVGGITGAVEHYAPSTDQWMPLTSSKPTRVSDIDAAAIGDQIYVPGGWTPQGRPTAVVEAYDLTHKTWSQVSPLPRPLSAYALTVYEERIYLFGGEDDRGYANTTYIYDPQTDKWREGQNMPTQRAYIAAATMGAHIFVIGGYDGRREHATCEVYSPGEDSWEICEPLVQGRGGLGMASVGTRLYIVGGGWSNDNNLTFSEEYDPKPNTKREFFGTSVSRQWRNLAVASKSDKFYAAGGWNGDYLNNVWEYVLLDSLIFIPSPP